jgi:hypothetical protein
MHDMAELGFLVAGIRLTAMFLSTCADDFLFVDYVTCLFRLCLVSYGMQNAKCQLLWNDEM